MAKLEVIFDSNPSTNVESIYGMTKELAKSGSLRHEDVKALAELMEELSNRMKEGEFSGEQEG